MNIWTGLLFLDGAVADARLARDLADTGTAAPSSRTARPGETEAQARAVEAVRACGTAALCPPTGVALR